MILFVVSVFFNYKNPVAGHVTVGIAGIFVVLVGIICGFGLAMWCGIQFVAFTGILLFLVLGIGKENLDSWKIEKQSSGGVLQKKVFLKISQDSQENTCARVSFIKKETLQQVFSREFCEISSGETPPVAASGNTCHEFECD